MRAKIIYKDDDADPEEYNVGSMTEFMVAAFCAFNSSAGKPKSVELLNAEKWESDGELYYNTIKTVKRPPTKVDIVKAGVRDIKGLIRQIKKEAGIEGLSVKITFENQKFSEKELASIMKLAK